MDESKSEGGKVLGEPKWVLEGSEKGCFSLWKITRNSTGNEFDRLSRTWSDLGAVKWRI